MTQELMLVIAAMAACTMIAFTLLGVVMWRSWRLAITYGLAMTASLGAVATVATLAERALIS